ncbi:hypothetical protein ACFUC1_13175 [Pedococcus sp. NPDC057267]|uniref:hypothetical protein n=1 Tax=Pedococcus sp. NPDC057267 TaxID=3346077 RepID=UPI00362604AD
MLCAAVVHVVRANVVDVAVFGGTGVLMLVLLRRDLATRGAPAGLASRWTGAGAALLVGGTVALQPRDSALVQVVLAAVGVVALLVLLRAGSGAPTLESEPLARTWVWVTILLAGCVVELVSFLAQPDAWTDNPDHPTLSALVDPMLGDHPARALVAAAWVLAGWRLLRLLADRGPGPGGAP